MSLDPKKRAELEAALQGYVGLEVGPPERGPSPVNEPMIHHWCEILEDRNPVYSDPAIAKRSVHGGIVAPPAMLHAWVMHGVEMARLDDAPANREFELHQLLAEYGYTAVVGTNVEQRFTRYLRPGDEVSQSITIDSISDEKATALGVGYFIETRNRFTDQNGEEVGEMRFRTLRYRAAQLIQAKSEDAPAAAQPTRLRPPLGHDNAWWWEGIAAGELLIQKCKACGELRHPPSPMCGKCQSLEWETQPARGEGRVHSFTVMHYPKFPGFEYPFVAALIDLAEGTRIVSNVVDCEPGDVHIGMPVVLSIESVDDEMKLPLFRPAR